MWKKILLGLIALIAIFAVVVAMQPDEYAVTRSLAMRASPSAVFDQVNDFHKWNDWSPWAKLDPKAENSFEGPDSGKGAIFRWKGNSDVGEGSMTILDSRPGEHVAIDLTFIKPMAGSSLVDFTFKPSGDATNVTWTMRGKNNFVGKAMCLFMNMDKMLGGSFEEGLAKLKSVVEGH